MGFTADDALRTEFLNSLKLHFKHETPLPVICANGKKTYIVAGITEEGGEIILVDPHFQEKLSLSDFVAFFANNPSQDSSDNEESKRKLEMLTNGMRWENVDSFFQIEPFWSFLFGVEK